MPASFSIPLVQKGAAGGVAELGTDGKLKAAQVPDIVAGSVGSVNGHTGIVVLVSSDVGAAPVSHTHPQSDVTGLPAALSGEANTRAAADTALSGRLDSVEGTLPLKADLVGGVIPTGQLPSIAIVDSYPVGTRAAMLALNAQTGDVAVVTTDLDGLSRSYILQTAPASTFTNWLELKTPSGGVSSVNGHSGSVVLGYVDVGAAAASHTHAQTDITGLASALAAKADASALTTEATARATADALLAPLASPALTGNPTAPTQTALNASTRLATTAYTDSAVGVEATARAAATALLAPLASPALTGNPTAPTQTAGNNSTRLATTAYVDTGLGTKAATVHTHAIADVTGLQSALDAAGTGGGSSAPTLTHAGNLGATQTITLSSTAEKWVDGTVNANLTVTAVPVAGARARLYATCDATAGRTVSVYDGVTTTLVATLAANTTYQIDISSPDGTLLITESSIAPQDATLSIKGVISLGGDLGGSGSVATAPVISDLAVTPRKLSDLARVPWANTGVIAETFPRRAANINLGTIALTSGTLKLMGGCVIPAGRTVTNIQCYSGATAAATSTHVWFCLVDRNLNVVAKTTDDTAASPWSANTRKILALSSTYTPASNIEVYIGVVVVATTTPTLMGYGAPTVVNASTALSGYSTTGLTNPASLGSTAAAITYSATNSTVMFAELT